MELVSQRHNAYPQSLEKTKSINIVETIGISYSKRKLLQQRHCIQCLTSPAKLFKRRVVRSQKLAKISIKDYYW